MVDEKTKMNEMLKTMLDRGPVPGGGTTVFGADHSEAERKLTDKINDVHNLQHQYNRGKEEIESWIRKKKELKQEIHNLDQQKKDAKNQIKDQAERQKLESQRADVNRLKQMAAAETLNVQFQKQLNEKQQQLKDKELDIQLKLQQIGQNTVDGDLKRANTQNKAKNIELQALKQTLASNEFNEPDKALIEEYKKQEL